MASATPKPVIKIDIFSDIACPWCWVGKRRLDLAMESAASKAQFKPEWHAYLLDPDFPAEGVPQMEYYKQKFGAKAESLAQHIKDSGAPDGATFAAWKWRGNTVAGHRLLALARKHGKDHEASELLFRKAFEEGANLSEPGEVIDVGERLGLPDVAEYVRDSEAGAEEVREDDEMAKYRLQVTGVPFFLVGLEDSNKRFSFSGAQPVGNWQEIFDKVLQEAASTRQGGEGR